MEHTVDVLPATDQTTAAESAGPPTTRVTLEVNGSEHPLDVDNRMSLLDALREKLALTGSKKGCDHGQCGACTVLIDGRRANSCLTLAVSAEGSAITTVEGLAGDDGALHPVQQAFLDRDAYQCGYCTPGQICSAIGMLREAREGWPSHATHDVALEGVVLDDDEVRERMSGNLCRCGAYVNIVPAVLDAADGSATRDAADGDEAAATR
jgi:xanthine dehydrogenase YagT iron-sulfur-binding subunit